MVYSILLKPNNAKKNPLKTEFPSTQFVFSSCFTTAIMPLSALFLCFLGLLKVLGTTKMDNIVLGLWLLKQFNRNYINSKCSVMFCLYEVVMFVKDSINIVDGFWPPGWYLDSNPVSKY